MRVIGVRLDARTDAAVLCAAKECGDATEDAARAVVGVCAAVERLRRAEADPRLRDFIARKNGAR